MHRHTLIMMLLGLVACGADTDPKWNAESPLEIAVAANTAWPYEAVGILDIVDAGYGESDSPEWAIGMLVADVGEFGVLIRIDGAVIDRAGIDIDSGEQVRVWLESPTTEYGEKIHVVSRIEGAD